MIQNEDMRETIIDIFEIDTDNNDNDDNNNRSVIDTFYGTYESLMRIDSSTQPQLALLEQNQN